MAKTRGSGGAVTFNPSTAWDYANAVVSDATSIYVVGSDSSPGLGNTQWRIEKRAK